MATNVRLAGWATIGTTVLIGFALWPSSGQPPPTSQRPSATAPTNPVSGSPGVSSPPWPPLKTLLPLSGSDLDAAIQQSTRAATTYLTYRYDEAPAVYLRRLHTLITPELYAALARTEATPGIRSQRDQDHEVATAHATPTKIRAISAGSVILIVHATRDIATTGGRHQTVEDLAVTAVKTPGGGWSVADIEPAAAGNQGETSDAGGQ